MNRGWDKGRRSKSERRTKSSVARWLAVLLVVMVSVSVGASSPETAVAADVSLEFDVSVQRRCGEEVTHRLMVKWQVQPPQGPVEVAMSVSPSSGPDQQAVAQSPAGLEHFDLQVPTGGHVVVLAHAATPAGDAEDMAAVQLEACEEPDRPDPGGGFRSGGPTGEELPDGARGGPLRESDVVHLGGNPHGPVAPIMVSGAGTGAAARLTSWTVDVATQEPIRLQHTQEVLEGSGIALHVLARDPAKTEPSRQLLLGGIVDDDILWLSTWRVAPDGSFEKLDVKGYGGGNPSAVDAFFVEAFAIEDRRVARTAPRSSPRFQVVTPVMGTSAAVADPVLRLVTWSVDADTGQITGLQASHDWGQPNPAGVIDVVHQREQNRFVVGYRDVNNLLVSHYWQVASTGSASEVGVATSGLPIDAKPGDDGTLPTEFHNLFDLALAELTDHGFLSALRGDLAGEPAMVSWESRIIGCDGPCFSRPFQLGLDQLDTDPGPGVALSAPPTVTHSRADRYEPLDHWGSRLAIGDFDGDGSDDLAVGVPAEDAGGTEDVGVVDIMYGSDPDGLSGSFRDQVWHRNAEGIPGDFQKNEIFGDAVAAGDFDGDGRDDLAIGISRADVGDELDAGEILVLYGSPDGLVSDGHQVWSRATVGIAGDPLFSELFGEVLAAGDFDGDGRDDLAIGVPQAVVGGVEDAGEVHLLPGGPSGLLATSSQIWHQDVGIVSGQAGQGDLFGWSLAAGDATGDGRDDLAIGVIGEDVGEQNNAGAVNLLRGSVDGLTDMFNHLWHQDRSGIEDHAEPSDRFGAELTFGDVNGDGHADLAVGVPDEDLEGIDAGTNAGVVHLLYADPNGSGLTSVNSQLWRQGIPGLGTSPGESEAFGAALAAADFDGDGAEDLAIGVHGESFDDMFAVGAVRQLRGSLCAGQFEPCGGLTTAGTQLLIQGQDGLKGAAEEDDRFGATLAVGDLDGSGLDDLAVGVPNEGVDAPFDSEGLVSVIYSDGGNGLTGADDEAWKQGVWRLVRAILADASWEETWGYGVGELFETRPPGEPILGPNASVGKFMSLLLAVEAIEAGEIALDHPVEISQHAAETGGSHMGPGGCEPASSCLEAGDKMPLDLLLHGMMLVSGNRAAVAVAEKVGGGSEQTFVDRMNSRANEIHAELGVDPRFDEGCMEGFHPDHEPTPATEEFDPELGLACFTHPAGSSVTTTQDLVTLWLYGSQYPLFTQIASEMLFDGCGVDADGQEKCFLLKKFGDSGYPGLGGWKGGNGGHQPSLGLPFCTTCRIVEATRLNRKMVVVLQQTGDWKGDVTGLFNWGYQTQFTPDRRGDSETDAATSQPTAAHTTKVKDFGLDAITDTLAVTASISPTNELEVCTWEVQAGAGVVALFACADGEVTGLVGGPLSVVRTTLIDLALLSELEADGDYVAGHARPVDPANEVYDLVLTVWRVGPKSP